MRDCKHSAILHPLGCPLWLAEYPCISAFSGLWSYTTGWDTTPSMASDMVCHCLEGELAVDQGTGKEFLVKAGDVWSCKKGMPETTENRGTTVAIMRVIPLLAPA